MVRKQTLGTFTALVLALASPALAQEFQIKEPLPVEVEVEVMINFECRDGFRITQERQLSFTRCHGALPATCTETRYELLECIDGRFEKVAEWSGGTDCSYDFDGTTCVEVLELGERDFMPLGPGPYEGDPSGLAGRRP